MHLLAPLLGLAMIAVGIGYAAWRAAWLFWRGQKDHVWFFRDANQTAIFCAVTMVTIPVVYLIVEGPSPKTIIWAVLAVILVPMPHAVYIAGRFWGIWRRSKADTSKRPAS